MYWLFPDQSVTTREIHLFSKDALKNGKSWFDWSCFYSKGDSVNMIPVRTGIQDDEYIYIKQGLQKGDSVVFGTDSAISRTLETRVIRFMRTKRIKRPTPREGKKWFVGLTGIIQTKFQQYEYCVKTNYAVEESSHLQIAPMALLSLWLRCRFTDVRFLMGI